MNTTNRREYYVNAVTLVPWSWGVFSMLGFYEKILHQAGFDGLYYLPLRGLRFVPKNIKIGGYQRAWNSSPAWRLPLRYLRIDPTDSSPLLQDVMLFGRYPIPQRVRSEGTENVLTIVDALARPNETVLEIHPELLFQPFASNLDEMALFEILRASGVSFAWDTYHAVRGARDGNPGFSSWRKLFEVVRPNIRVIHVHPTRDCPLQEQTDMLAALGTLPKRVPVVVEMLPTTNMLVNPKHTSLNSVVNNIKNALGD